MATTNVEPQNLPPQPDVLVSNHGSVCLVYPVTHEAHVWITEHLSEDSQFIGENLVVEPRYLITLVTGMEEDGLTVKFEVR